MKFAWRWGALKNGFKDAIAYRWEFFFEILSSAIVPPSIQWILWYAVFEVGNASSLGGMSYADAV